MNTIEIENGQRLEAIAGRQYIAWINAVDAELGYHVPLTEGLRTWERQNYLYQGWIHRLPGFNLALSPDTPSVHQNGKAGDLGGGVGTWTSRAHAVAAKHAAAYGFVFNVASEGWHAEFRAALVVLWAETDIEFTYGAGSWAVVKASRAAQKRRDEGRRRAAAAAAAEALRILTLKKKGPLMWIKSLKSGNWYLLGETTSQTITDIHEAKAISAGLGYNATQLPSATCRRLIDQTAERAAVQYRALAAATGIDALAKAVDEISAEIKAQGAVETYAADPTDDAAPVATMP